MPKLQELQNRFLISVPKDIVRMKNWKKGDTLVWGFDSKTGDVVIKKIE